MLLVLWMCFSSVGMAICYRDCDDTYSSCYLQCKRNDTCRSLCAKSRHECIEPCTAAPSDPELLVILLTNAKRESLGLGTLTWNPRLARAARGHAYAMARAERMAHALDGAGPGDRISVRGYHGKAWAENVFAGWGKDHDTPDAAVAWWIQSPAHYANLIDPKLTEIGVGIRQGTNGKTYYCQNFGAR